MTGCELVTVVALVVPWRPQAQQPPVGQRVRVCLSEVLTRAARDGAVVVDFRPKARLASGLAPVYAPAQWRDLLARGRRP